MGKHDHATDNTLSTLPFVFLLPLHQVHNIYIQRHVTAKEVKKKKNNNIKDKLQTFQQ